MIDSTVKETFQEQGYYVFKNAFSREEIKELVKATDKALTLPKNVDDLLTINKTQHVHKILYMFVKDDAFLKALVHHSILKFIFQIVST